MLLRQALFTPSCEPVCPAVVLSHQLYRVARRLVLRLAVDQTSAAIRSNTSRQATWSNGWIRCPISVRLVNVAYSLHACQGSANPTDDDHWLEPYVLARPAHASPGHFDLVEIRYCGIASVVIDGASSSQTAAVIDNCLPSIHSLTHYQSCCHFRVEDRII